MLSLRSFKIPNVFRRNKQIEIIKHCSKCDKPLLGIHGNVDWDEFGGYSCICDECMKELGIEVCCGKPMKIENACNIHSCHNCGTIKRSHLDKHQNGVEKRFTQILTHGNGNE